MVWKGSTYQSWIIPNNTQDFNVNYLLITNMSGFDVIINLQIKKYETITQVSPLNMTLKAGDSYNDQGLVILKGESFIIDTTGLINYYVSLK